MDTARNLDVPYVSLATEFVRVIENREDFISLQHILVMFFSGWRSGVWPHGNQTLAARLAMGGKFKIRLSR